MTTFNTFPMNALPFNARVLSGLQTNNTLADTNNSIDIAAGLACDDNGVAYKLAAGIVRSLAATFGTGNGGLFSGAGARAVGWYHLWLIRNNTTSAIDVGFDNSSTGANVPTGWTKICRIWSVYTTSTVLRQYKQIGDTCRFFQTTAASANGARTYGVLQIDVPVGFLIEALLKVVTNVAAGGGSVLQIGSGVDGISSSRFLGGYVSSGACETAFDTREIVNLSGQIYVGISNSNSWGIFTYGYVDRRGKEN